MRTIAVANQKGGVAKTTTAVNTAAALVDAGYPALVIDLDPQGTATRWLGADVTGAELFELLTEDQPPGLDDLVTQTIERVCTQGVGKVAVSGRWAAVTRGWRLRGAPLVGTAPSRVDPPSVVKFTGTHRYWDSAERCGGRGGWKQAS